VTLYYYLHFHNESKHTYARADGHDDFGFLRLNACEPVGDIAETCKVWIENEQFPNKPYEDVPWLFGSTGEMVASSKFCKLVAGVDSRCAQFIPVQARYKEKSNLPPDYYSLVNWLHLVDITDYDQSEMRTDHAIGYSYMHDHVIDWSLVPSGIPVFRIKHRPTFLYCTKAFVDILKSNGITGLFAMRAN